MATRRVEVMSRATSDLLAASYAVPNLIVAVQEAVYNAIDAQARHVSVVVDAAQASFTVVDDGDGIHPDAIFEHIFEYNASSRISDSTSTYGGQGQYLAAIGALAQQVELDSRVENQWSSFRKVVQNGQIVFNARSKTTMTAAGTRLLVRDLFWRLPVRKRELEERVSTRTRLAKHLSSFFRCISMIWPKLSIDVTFTDAKVPRCIIPGVSSCEERLRCVFGDLLGGELEYMTFDVAESPFTIRGYVGVVRHLEDGDAYLESPGWRQASAYYQYVFLDNFWLEDFQRECCKTINNASISLMLGIPIFVLKISAKSLEYEIHSDGETRAVNLKRPEQLTETLRALAQHFKTRLIDADARIEATSPNEREEHTSSEPPLCEGHSAVAKKTYPEQTPTFFEDDSSGCNNDGNRCQDQLEGTSPWFAVTNVEQASSRTDEDVFEDRDCFYDDQDRFEEDKQVKYEYHLRDQTYPVIQARECLDRYATPSTIAYGELPTVVAYEQAPTMLVYDGYEDAQYHGCAQCCCNVRSVPFPFSLGTQRQQYLMYERPLQYTSHSIDTYDAYQPQSYECDYVVGTEVNHGQFESVAMPEQVVCCEELGEYVEFGGYEMKTVGQPYERGDEFHRSEPEERYSATLVSDPHVHTTVQHNQHREYDQLLFGKSLPPGSSRMQNVGRHEFERVCTRKEETKTDTEQWVSSRRVGVVEVAKVQSVDAVELKAANAGQITPTQARSMRKRRDEFEEFDRDEQDRFLGSEQLSNFFSVEKLAKSHSRSLGPAISRFANKRTALAERAGASDSAYRREVHVKNLPSDLHAPSAKMTLNKAMLRDLQVIKQVDRKFILVKANHSNCAPPDTNMSENERSRTLLLCIDQHAADERVRLEQLELEVFGSEGDERNVQVVNHDPPLVLSLNGLERDTLRLFAGDIRSWGFNVEAMDAPIVQLTQTPRVDTRVTGADDFREYLQLLTRSDAVIAHRVVRPPAITRFLHSRACRSAIMFGDFLSLSQCEDIIDQLRKCKLPFQCAHGRPSIVPLLELI